MRKSILLFFLLMNISMAFAQKSENPRMLRHVVMFGWKEGTDPAIVKKIVTAFRELPSKISQINGFEWGTNNSKEGLTQGLTHCFFLSFKSEEDRDAYLIHPDHKAFVALLKPAPDKITVLDYWTEK